LVFGRNTWYLAETLGIWQKHLVFGRNTWLLRLQFLLNWQLAYLVT